MLLRAISRIASLPEGIGARARASLRRAQCEETRDIVATIVKVLVTETMPISKADCTTVPTQLSLYHVGSGFAQFVQRHRVCVRSVDGSERPCQD